MSRNGKGSNRRPFNRNKFEGNYDHALGKRSRDGRSRDLAALQSTIYIKLSHTGPKTHKELVEWSEAEAEDVSIALQALKKKGSIVYLQNHKVWGL